MPARLPSYVCGPSDVPLLGATIGGHFDRMVARYADHEALVARHQGLRYTYAELADEVDRCARALLAAGFANGERIGIWSQNRAEWAIVQYATAKIGAVLVNINPAYRLHELEYALVQSGCSALVIAPSFKSSDYTAMLRELAPELDGSTPGRLRARRLPELRAVVRFGAEASPGMWSWPELLALAPGASAADLVARQAELDFDDPINIQYTSGTTGRPKGATLSHHNILNNGRLVAEIMRFTDLDRLVVPVPLYHCFGMVMGNLGCMTHGACAIYPSEGFEPLAVLETVAAERATALFGVPTMFIAELEHPDFERFDLSSLRTGIMAGAPCPVEVMKKVRERMHMEEVEIAYGMTETSPVSFQTRADAPLTKRVATVGQIHPHLECKIVDPAGAAVVERGTPGELCTRGYSVMLGYWNDDDATRTAIDRARWMHTGDLAVMDEEGWVTISGRIKDMVIRGGENIYPREIEEFLHAHPEVSDAQVIGVPDPRLGEELMAWVKLREGCSATEEEMRAYCRDKIAHYKVPRYWKFVEEFPMTVTGKVRKFVMREQAVEALGLGDAGPRRVGG